MSTEPPALGPVSGQVPTREMPQAHDALQRGASVGRYLVLDKLGEGGMGLVYAAYDPELNRKVAVKLLRPSVRGAASPATARLLREAQAMAKISHPNVISVFDVGALGENQVFVAMEFVDGGTLNDWLVKQKRTVREVIKLFIEAGRGLAAAHAAGLVHRDFKPENVLLGSDGRVRVTDFGLARLTNDEHELPGEGPTAPGVPAPALGSRLTQAGAIVGTPLFMSPEQHRRQTPDARSDQFNFCASLYWAIYGSSPLLGLERIYLRRHQQQDDDHTSTVDTVGSGAQDDGPTLVKEFPKEPRLPASVRRTLQRGLSLDPDGRYPSMEELLKHLSYDPQVAQRRWAIGIGAAAAVVVVGVAYQRAISRHSQLCQGAETKLATVWNPGVKEQMEKAFAASASPYANHLKPQVDATLDEYGKAWAAMRTDACEATRLRGEQTDEVLTLRIACLDRRLVSMGALTRILAAADAKAVEKSLDAALALPGLGPCADVAALKSPIPLPEDQATRARVDELERKLAESKALADSGDPIKSKKVVDEAMAGLKDVHYAPIRAEVLDYAGWMARIGDTKKAEEVLEEAVAAGEEGRKDDEKARALARLVFVVGYLQGRTEDAARWKRLADAAVRRAATTTAETDLANFWGNVLIRQGRNAEAAAVLEKGYNVALPEFGPLDQRTNALLSNWAAALQRGHKPEQALKLITKSVEATEKKLGVNHPTVGGQRRVLAQVYLDMKDYKNANDELQKALAIHKGTLGAESSEVAYDLDWLAITLLADGEYGEALHEAQHSMSIRERMIQEKTLSSTSGDLAFSLENIGQAYLGMRKPQDAVTALERAIAIHEKNSHDAPEMAEARFALARALWDAGKDKKRAAALAELARTGYTTSKDEERVMAVARWQVEHPSGAANKGGSRR
ncbi:MAG TPA: tetratricopeptide repeat protein [Myxococcaceae bacterium]|nr:tetratricopeptide repeat protein [Myxococcaceae bacterium]